MASLPGPHTGILRDETIALRKILGYRLDTIRDSTFKHPKLDNLPHLQGSSIKDVLFVSVDVDTGGGYEAISPEQSFHIGISLFDTRTLTKPMENPGNAIQSYQYITKDSKPCKWAAKSFLFGDTELLQLPQLTNKLAALTQGREYVLVAHGINEDLKFLNNLDPNIAAKACYIMDTVNAAQHPLQLYYRYSLEKLLNALGIRYDRLHVAGNDAHFALRALLMLAVRDGQMAPESITAADRELFNALNAVAHADYEMPVWTERQPNPKAAPKLGIYAKRRLKAARKASKRLLQELPFADELDEQDAQGEHENT
ncbi:QDE-2-interacting protein [Trichoderma aethiopicum]